MVFLKFPTKTFGIESKCSPATKLDFRPIVIYDCNALIPYHIYSLMLTSQSLPVYPGAHEQVLLRRLSALHVPPFWHGFCSHISSACSQL